MKTVATHSVDSPALTSATALEVTDLSVEFRTRRGIVKAVCGLSYSLRRGSTLAIVGESGSGKSVGAHAVLGVLKSPPAFVTGGSALLNGRDLLTMSPAELRRARGAEIALISQVSSLNPVYTVGWQVGEPFRIHRGMSFRASTKRAAELLDQVGIPSAASRMDAYPHEFSGGMRQRVSIAMAMALEPDVLIADEPTTALDVTVQSQIMQLLATMKEELGMALVLITHDLALVSEYADSLVVMYAGQECETGAIEDVFRAPAHPYTAGLMRSMPSLEGALGRLQTIEGAPPDLMSMPAGCAFSPRCDLATAECSSLEPPLVELGHGRTSRCHHTEKVRDE